MGPDNDGADGTGPPARQPARDEVERLLAERGEHLMRAAVALTGNRSDGEDLLQAALERLLRHWGRIEGDAEGYLRRTLYNMAADAVDAVDLRDALGRALAQLPPRQRAVLVLRYREELSQAETAELLGCAEGTVKSAAARGLRRLRELTAPWDDHRPQLTEKM